MRIVNPPGWPRPKGYSNGIEARGRQVYVAGMVGWSEKEQFESDDFVAQFRRTLQNIVAVLRAADAGPEHVVRMTMYLIDKREYQGRLAEVGDAWREVMGRSYPVMAAVEVKGLMEPRARLEIEATAVVPDN
jgi:enamine deaminase RidA (YjgF/YER057c/UK114 family)